MAERTQVPPHRAGAGETAPTAPHATPPEGKRKRRTGPERFWANRAVRVGMVLGAVASLGVHYALAPWTLFPQHSDELHDFDDAELTIPVDLANEQEQQKPEQPQTNEPAQKTDEGEGAKANKAKRDAGVEQETDGGAELDAAIEDGGAEPSDAEAPIEGDGGDNAQAAPGDPNALLGAAGKVQAGPPLVQLVVNFAVIRSTPVGSQMGPLMSAIPQWDDFIAGTGVDAVRDTDWIYIQGPSLLHTERDMIYVHYSASDKAVDHAVDVVAHKYDRGGVFDAGVPGVKASLGHADRAPRVFLRPQSHLLIVVPPDFAHTAALAYKGTKIGSPTRPGEALSFTIQNPGHVAPFAITPAMQQARLWIVPRASDGGADVYAEGNCADASAAQENAAKASRYVQDQNSLGVRMLTNGLLNGVDIHAEGSTVKGHLSATREQLQNILGLVAGQLGVALQQNGSSAN